MRCLGSGEYARIAVPADEGGGFVSACEFCDEEMRLTGEGRFPEHEAEPEAPG